MWSFRHSGGSKVQLASSDVRTNVTDNTFKLFSADAPRETKGGANRRNDLFAPCFAGFLYCSAVMSLGRAATNG